MGRRGVLHAIAAVLAVGLAALAPEAARAQTFQGLGFLPGDTSSQAFGVNANGSVVVGQGATGTTNTLGFLWTAAGGMVSLGSLPPANGSNATAVSADGSTVAGFITGPAQSPHAPSIEEAARWTAATGWVGLASLSTLSEATGISADGSVIVGQVIASGNQQSFRWTAGTGLITLPPLPGFTGGYALGVSADGTVIVGSSFSNSNPAAGAEAYRYTSATGMVGLGFLLPGDNDSLASAASADGSVIVGQSRNNTTNSPDQGYRWTAATGMVNLGDLPGDNEVAPRSTNSNGSVVVGLSGVVSQPGQPITGLQAFLWDQVYGMQNLQQILVSEYGLNLQGWSSLMNPNAEGAIMISADGSTIVGGGTGPNGNMQAYRVTGLLTNTLVTGTYTVAAGTNNQIGMLGGAGTVQIGAGGSLSVAGNNTSSDPVNFPNSVFSGTITGAGDLIKAGSGVWLFSGSFQSSGNLFVNGGTLQLGAANAFVNTVPVTVASGATLNLAGFNQTIGSLSGSGAVALGAGSMTVGNANTSTSFSGVISGSGGLTKTGSGTMTLSGANTYTDATTVNAGTLAIGAGGSIASSSGIMLAASGTIFDMSGGGNQTIKDLSGVAGSQVTLGGNALTLGTANTTTFAGVISGSGGIIKQGSGTLTLSGASTYTGATTIAGGTLALSGIFESLTDSSGVNLTAAGATFDVSATQFSTIQGLSGVAGTNLTIGDFLTLNQTGHSTFAGAIAGGGFFIDQGTGTLTLTGASTFNGFVQVTGGGTLCVGNNSALGNAVLELSNGSTLQAAASGLTLPNLVQLGGTGTETVDTQTNTLTLSGGIIGSGSFTKIGTGTLTLTEFSAYTGGTTLTGGTLAVGNNSALGSGTLAMAAGTTLSWVGGSNFNIGNNIIIAGDPNFAPPAGTTQTISGVISDGGTPGTLNMVGPGTLLLTGANTYTGATTVGDGALGIGAAGFAGASVAGSVSVANGATLFGRGTIGGSLTNAGTVVPNSALNARGVIGTLTVGGNYAQSTAGTLTIEVSPTSASKLAVGGAASLAGTLALNFAPGTYTPASYTLLTAASLSGTFSTVTGANPSGLPQAILYNDPSVVLQLGFGGTVAPTNDTVYSAATSIAVMNAQQVNGIILDRLGQRQAGIADGQIAALAPGGIAGTQLAQAGGGNGAALGEVAAALPDALSSQGMWFRGIGGFASVNGNSTAPGFTGSTGGFFAGYDRAVAPNLYLGLTGGYLHSNIDEHSTSSGTEGSLQLNVYGGVMTEGGLFAATAGYANDRFVTNRGIAGIGTASENHGGNEATAAGQWSLPLTIAGYGGSAATLTPKAGIQYLYLFEGAFSETGASGFDLGNSGHGTDSLQPFIGAALAQKFVTDGGAEITPELRLGYAHEVFDSRVLTVTSIGGAAFPVGGVKPSRDQLTAGLGLVMQAAPNLSAYADYDTMLHTGNTTEQVVQAGLRWKF